MGYRRQLYLVGIFYTRPVVFFLRYWAFMLVLSFALFMCKFVSTSALFVSAFAFTFMVSALLMLTWHHIMLHHTMYMTSHRGREDSTILHFVMWQDVTTNWLPGCDKGRHGGFTSRRVLDSNGRDSFGNRLPRQGIGRTGREQRVHRALLYCGDFDKVYSKQQEDFRIKALFNWISAVAFSNFSTKQFEWYRSSIKCAIGKNHTRHARALVCFLYDMMEL